MAFERVVPSIQQIPQMALQARMAGEAMDADKRRTYISGGNAIADRILQALGIMAQQEAGRAQAAFQEKQLGMQGRQLDLQEYEQLSAGRDRRAGLEMELGREARLEQESRHQEEMDKRRLALEETRSRQQQQELDQQRINFENQAAYWESQGQADKARAFAGLAEGVGSIIGLFGPEARAKAGKEKAETALTEAKTAQQIEETRRTKLNLPPVPPSKTEGGPTPDIESPLKMVLDQVRFYHTALTSGITIALADDQMKDIFNRLPPEEQAAILVDPKNRAQEALTKWEGVLTGYDWAGATRKDKNQVLVEIQQMYAGGATTGKPEFPGPTGKPTTAPVPGSDQSAYNFGPALQEALRRALGGKR